MLVFAFCSLEMATGLVFRFVIGHSTDDWKMQELDKEIEEHKDFIRIDVDESYQNLNLKTYGVFFSRCYHLWQNCDWNQFNGFVCVLCHTGNHNQSLLFCLCSFRYSFSLLLQRSAKVSVFTCIIPLPSILGSKCHIQEE
jgi:hypothetical protein